MSPLTASPGHFRPPPPPQQQQQHKQQQQQQPPLLPPQAQSGPAQHMYSPTRDGLRRLGSPAGRVAVTAGGFSGGVSSGGGGGDQPVSPSHLSVTVAELRASTGWAGVSPPRDQWGRVLTARRSGSRSSSPSSPQSPSSPKAATAAAAGSVTPEPRKAGGRPPMSEGLRGAQEAMDLLQMAMNPQAAGNAATASGGAGGAGAGAGAGAGPGGGRAGYVPGQAAAALAATNAHAAHEGALLRLREQEAAVRAVLAAQAAVQAGSRASVDASRALMRAAREKEAEEERQREEERLRREAEEAGAKARLEEQLRLEAADAERRRVEALGPQPVPVTAPLDPTALAAMPPASALATVFLGLRQNVMQFRFATASELAAMAKDLERCAAKPQAALREFKDGHLKVQQAVVMLGGPGGGSAGAGLGGAWRLSEAAVASAAPFHKAQILTGLRRMVVAFDQASEAQRGLVLRMPAVVANLDKYGRVATTS